MLAEKPLIFLLILMVQLWGYTASQVMLYEINMAIKKKDKKQNIFNTKDFQNKLKSGIIRPFLVNL
jgi:hypothetical protein